MRSCISIALGVIALLALTPAGPAFGQEAKRPTIVCTLPALTAIAREVGGDAFEYVTLAKPDQDPHFVSPRPALMQKTSQAALLIEIGMMLEQWADQVADGSGNPRIFRGGPGRIIASAGIPFEEAPSVISRAMGDLHPQGNPHIWLDPIRAKTIAANIGTAMIGIAPSLRRDIEARLRRFQERIDAALFGAALVDLVGSRKLTRLVLDGSLWSFLDTTEVGGEKLRLKLGGWLATAQPLRGLPVVEYHKVWVYFSKAFGLDLAGTIEEKPGIPAGPRHQREITEQIRSAGVKLILVDNFYDPSMARRIAEDTGARVLVLPNQPGGEPGTDDYFRFIDYLLGEMTAALQ